MQSHPTPSVNAEPRSSEELHAIGAELARELLSELPPAPRPHPIGTAIFDFFDAIDRVDLEAC